jgi:aryl-alcohol dehydrogenase-like predicted oxidoreductase
VARRALGSGRFDTVMAGVHLLDQGAADTVFARCEAADVGGLAMFVVRRLLRDEASLRNALERLAAAGHVPAGLARAEAPLEAILGRPVASVPRLAYRFAASLPGVHAVLSGASHPGHLRANVEAVLAPPLPAEEIAALRTAFGDIPGPVFA